MRKYLIFLIFLPAYTNLFAQEAGDITRDSGWSALGTMQIIIDILIIAAIVFLYIRQKKILEKNDSENLLLDMKSDIKNNYKDTNKILDEVIVRLDKLENSCDKDIYTTVLKEKSTDQISNQKLSTLTFSPQKYYGNYNEHYNGFLADKITLENTGKCFVLTQTGEKTATFELCKVNGNYHEHVMAWDYRIFPLCECIEGSIEDDMEIEHITPGELELNNGIWMMKNKAKIRIK